MKGIRLPRRTFLRGALQGAVGVSVGLPALECMFDDKGERLLSFAPARAQASGVPRRYAVVFAGQAIGGDGQPRNQQRVNGQNVTEDGHFIAPPESGAGYTVTTPLTPLNDLGLLGDVNLVTGMRIPWVEGASFAADGSDVPPGGAYRDFHGGGCSPLLSGTRSTSPTFRCNGPTSDQVVAQANAGATNIGSLVLRAQPSWYLSGSDFSGREFISYSQAGNAGRIDAQTNPQIAWQSLFGNFTPDDAAAAALQDLNQRKRLSVLDLVLSKRDRLVARLGRADKVRLERHFDELRALEERVRAIPPPTTGTCQRLDDPGAPPAIGGDNAGATSDDIQQNTGYSGEHERARVLCDLIHMAFVCDLTRAAALQVTVFQSHMNVTQLSTDHMGITIRADQHEVGHNGDANNRGQLIVSKMLQWHISHYAYLLDKLKRTPEGAGNVLDNCAIVFMPEAGHGTQLNDGVSTFATHSVEDMALIVGGRAGGMQPGRHLPTNHAVHPAQVLLAAMNSVGVAGNTFGDVSGPFAPLFG